VLRDGFTYKQIMKTDYAIATTGNLDRQKEMKTPKSDCFIALATPNEVIVENLIWPTVIK
jgi:nicotinamide mononucleotide (NMN) deamidase PncC